MVRRAGQCNGLGALKLKEEIVVVVVVRGGGYALGAGEPNRGRSGGQAVEGVERGNNFSPQGVVCRDLLAIVEV